MKPTDHDILDTSQHMAIVANFKRVAQAQRRVDELEMLAADARSELRSAETERSALVRGFGVKS